jgi:MYXO-CTERM domain-containing protein
MVRDFALGECAAPPSPALTEAWCELHPESKLPACTGIMDPVDPMPNDGVGGGTMDAGDGATKPPVKMPTNAGDDGANTSSGCNVVMGRTTGGGLAFALGFVAAAVSLVRRRNR